MSRSVAAPPSDEERILRAAEFALGLRGLDEAVAALEVDPALALEIARWEEDLARFGDELKPVPLSLQTWMNLQAAVANEPPPANLAVARRPKKPGYLHDLLENLTFWRSLAGLGFATAAVLTLLLRVSGTVDPVTPPVTTRVLLVSPLLPRDGSPTYVATYDAARSTILIVPAATRPVAGRVPQLWLVPNDIGEPIALGSLDPERSKALPLTPEQAKFVDLKAGLVITLEANGDLAAGSASGPVSARGPVIAHGRFTAL